MLTRRCATAPADSRIIYHDIPGGFAGKLSFISNFTHSLCFENESFPGYLTEKMFDALFVGAVPLYVGDPLVEEWFERGSFLDCTNLEAQAIVAAMHGRADVTERVAQRREAVCRVSLEEMAQRTKDFHRQILAERGMLSC